MLAIARAGLWAVLRASWLWTRLERGGRVPRALSGVVWALSAEALGEVPPGTTQGVARYSWDRMRGR